MFGIYCQSLLVLELRKEFYELVNKSLIWILFVKVLIRRLHYQFYGKSFSL